MLRQKWTFKQHNHQLLFVNSHNKRSVSLSANLPRGLRLPEKRLVKQLTPNVCSMDYTYTIITKGRTSLLFQFFMRVVEVLGLEKAKRFLSHDCDGPSATSAKISIYFETTFTVSCIFCKSTHFLCKLRIISFIFILIIVMSESGRCRPWM